MTLRLVDKDLIDLRFAIGTRVECKCSDGWLEGSVVAQFYVQKNFKDGMAVPYQVRLDIGKLIFVPKDVDGCIRRVDFELHSAVQRGDVAKVHALLSTGASMIHVDQMGYTALDLAVTAAATKRDPNGIGLSIVIAMTSAAKDRNAGEVVDELRLQDRYGKTLFHHAVKDTSHEVVAELMSVLHCVGDDTAASVVNQKTCRKDELYDGQWGKKVGGELKELDNEDQTSLHIAIQRLAPESDDDDCSDDDELKPAIEEDEVDVLAIVRLLLNNGADVNAQDLAGRAPIHLAVGAGLCDLATLLLESGADPTMTRKSTGMQNNALHHATIKGDIRMLQLLLKFSSSSWALEINGAGQGGWIPLALAARSGNLETFEALLDAGADPDAIMTNGKSARDIARVNKRSAILATLETC